MAVLGGGIIGVCCALELVKAGQSVVLIDAELDQHGASGGNAGVISPWSIIPQSLPGLWRQAPGWVLDPDGPVAIRPGYAPKLLPWALRFLRSGRLQSVLNISDALAALNKNNVCLYRALLTEAGQPELLEDSYYVHAFRTVQGDVLSRLEYRIRERYGAELELIDGDALQDLEPAISSEFSGAVLVKGQGRARSPGLILRALRGHYTQLGGESRLARINKIAPDGDGGWTIRLDHGKLNVPKVVLALGAWSAKLLADLNIKVPLEAERGYHVMFETDRIGLRHSVMDVERKLVASSMSDGIRVAGTAEFTGLDRPPTPRRIERLKLLSTRMLPALAEAPSRSWMGHRPSFPDGLPAIGEVPGRRGLIAAFGHSHYGLMMAPRTGLIARDLVIGANPDIDLTPYQLGRFHGLSRSAFSS